MPRLTKKRSKKAGLPPGSLVPVIERPVSKVSIQIFNYDATKCVEKTHCKLEECLPYSDSPGITWINIDGLDAALVGQLGAHFKVHPLVLEDILNTDQRPKLEDFESTVFIVSKMLYFNKAATELQVEQVSFVFGRNFVISFQEEGNHDVFGPVRDRLKNPNSRLRAMGSDSLVHALLDAVVDHYFAVLEKLGEEIEVLEDAIISRPDPECVHRIHQLKREILFLRKAVWPLREVADELYRLENALVQESTRIFFRDIYDHTVQVIDMIETFRDMLSGLLDVYLSTISNRTNDIMKVLTMFTAVFIPLTFIAGIYGMNFEFMPELHAKWGYPIVLGSMAVIAVGILIYFRRKKWL